MKNSAHLSKTLTIRAALCLLIVGVVAFTFFLYLAFPFPTLAKRLVALVSEKTECDIHVGHIAHEFALHFDLQDIQVTCPKVSQPLTARLFSAQVAIVPLFKGFAEVTFQVSSAKGEITGKITLDRAGETGTLTFLWKDAVFTQLGKWVSPVGPFSFATIEMVGTWKGRTLTFQTLSAKGDQANIVSDRGTLSVRLPFMESRMDAHLWITPKGELQKIVALLVPDYTEGRPVPIRLTGSLASTEATLAVSR